jgi:hypothetical protein
MQQGPPKFLISYRNTTRDHNPEEQDSNFKRREKLKNLVSVEIISFKSVVIFTPFVLTD